MKSLIIAFSLFVFTEIRLTLCGETEVSPTTADEIRKVAVTERDAAIANAKLAYRNAINEINVVRQEADKVREENLKLVKEKSKRANAIASTIRRKALRDHAKILKDAKNEYAQAAEEAKQNLEKLNEESKSLVEAAEDQFVAKFVEMKDNKKKIESENEELLEKVRTEIEAEQKLARERRGQAVKEYKLGSKNKNAKSAEERNLLVAKYEEELGRYEKTMESLEEKWQKTLDDLGIGKEYETALENALMELEETKKKAGTGDRDATKEIAQAAIDARKMLDEKQASANAEKLRVEAEAKEILEAGQKHRNEALEKADKKHSEMQKLADAELDNAATKMYAAIAQASKEYETALKKAKEMEVAEKKTRSGKKNSQ